MELIHRLQSLWLRLKLDSPSVSGPAGLQRGPVLPASSSSSVAASSSASSFLIRQLQLPAFSTAQGFASASNSTSGNVTTAPLHQQQQPQTPNLQQHNTPQQNPFEHQQQQLQRRSATMPENMGDPSALMGGQLVLAGGPMTTAMTTGNLVHAGLASAVMAGSMPGVMQPPNNPGPSTSGPPQQGLS